MGELRLFQFLRAADVLQHGNRPYQRFVDAGYFRVREVPIAVGDGSRTRIHVQPLVTQAGVDYIRRRLDGEDGQGSLLPGRAPAGGPRAIAG
jgi:phage antirepressor YoqD-like protein